METQKIQLLKKITQDQKKFVILGICACIGLMLSFLPTLSGKHDTETSDELGEHLSDTEYVSSLEERLSETISSISGAGKAQVFITLESSYETVYMSNAKLDETVDLSNQSRTTSEKSIATMKNGSSSEEPVVVKHLSPKISGVLIVCEGGENTNVRNNIIKAASTALDVSSSRIYVTGGQSTP